MTPSPQSPRAVLRDQAVLDRAAALCLEAVEGAAAAGRLSESEEAKRASAAAVRAGMAALNTLLSPLGAANPLKARQEPVKRPDPLSLSALTALDTPAARDLLATLTAAIESAERVDAERGRTVGDDVPLLPGESRGTDYAETLSELTLRLRTEIHGPQGKE